jgi:hypothetical protein
LSVPQRPGSGRFKKPVGMAKFVPFTPTTIALGLPLQNFIECLPFDVYSDFRTGGLLFFVIF